jgi:hypothetical protein
MAARLGLTRCSVPTVVLRLLVGRAPNLWVVPVVSMFAGFTVGGHVAARRRPGAPYVHAAASAVVAFAAFLVFTVARRLLAGDGLSTPIVLTLAVLLQVTVSFALLGGYVAWRRAR